MVLWFLVIFSVCFVICNYVQCLYTWRKTKLSAGFLYPIFGHALLVSGMGTHGLFLKIREICSMFTSTVAFLGPYCLPILYDHKLVTHLFNSEKCMQKKADLYKVLTEIGKHNLFTITGTDYKENKRVLLDAVTHTNLKIYMNSFNENAKNLADNLKTKLDEKEFDLEPELNFCTISILLDTVMGLDSTKLNRDDIMTFGKEFSNCLGFVTQRAYSLWLLPDFTYKLSSLYRKTRKSVDYIRNVCNRLITERQKSFQENVDQKVVFIDKYFVSKKNNGEYFQIDEIIDGVLTIMGAGFETTLSSIGFGIMLLAMNQDVQTKVHKEIREKIEIDHDLHHLTIKDLSDLQYLDQVIHETWRLYPPVTFMGRKLTKEVVLPNGGHLDEGTNVFFNIEKLHRDPQVYPNPDVYNPDNFLPGKMESRPATNFIPFGYGARKCFGNVFAKLVIKTVLCNLLTKYSFHTTKTEEDFVLAFEITLKNRFGFPVSIKERTK